MLMRPLLLLESAHMNLKVMQFRKTGEQYMFKMHKFSQAPQI